MVDDYIPCPTCKRAQPHRSIEYAMPQGWGKMYKKKGKKIVEAKYWTDIQRKGTWVECTVCKAKHLYYQKGI